MSGNHYTLDFEEPLLELEKKIFERESFSQKSKVDLSSEIQALKNERDKKIKEIYSKLTPWQIVQIARHPARCDVTNFIPNVFEDFVELHGDRSYGDDKAILCGLCKIESKRVMLIATRKGKTTSEKISCNFGMPHPEGYKKALLKMKLAEKFKIPIITLINTPGAYPGIGAEERGQANIIAKNLFEMSKIRVPIISIVTGEGGSGGALGICVADKLSLLEYAYFSVITPEGCASILLRDSSKAPLAAEMLRLTSRELLKLGIIDEIIPEPLGGAHRNYPEMCNTLKIFLLKYLSELENLAEESLLEKRYQKYRKLGIYIEEQGNIPVASPDKIANEKRTT